RLNREQGLPIWVLENPGVTDFYDENDRFTVTPRDTKKYESFLEGLDDWERKVFDRAIEEDNNYYVLSFSNIGGLVMPIILDLHFADGTKERMHIPAEIWRRNARNVSKLLVFPKEKELTEVVLDPEWETADADINNNHYPRKIIESRVEAFKRPDPTSRSGRDLMAEVQQGAKKAAEEAAADEGTQ
ncbi:MAG: aminopeptidase, partial [Pseudomonadota bacterium]